MTDKLTGCRYSREEGSDNMDSPSLFMSGQHWLDLSYGTGGFWTTYSGFAKYKIQYYVNF